MARNGSVFELSEPELDRLLAQVPALSREPRTVELLPGGLTNRNAKVTTPDGVYVARCSDDNAEDLDIDRAAEFENTRAAAEAGVGAPVVDFRPDLRVLVIGYVEGRTLGNADFRRPGFLPRAAAALRQLHEGPRFTGEFDMFERQRRYRERCRSQGFPIAEGYDDHADSFAEIRRALGVLPVDTVPCNNDLLAENFIEDGDRIHLIDYEYSGNNDPFFELGNTWTETGLEPEHLEELVTAYVGRAQPHLVARAHLQAIVSQYGWSLWGFIQQALSPFDYDFHGWGMERYEGAVEEMRSPGFGALLEAATTPERSP
jgi:thiamine kinase-like enzyme